MQAFELIGANNIPTRLKILGDITMSKEKMNTLFLSGISDEGSGRAIIGEGGQVNVALTGSCNLQSFFTDLPGQQHSFCMAGPGGQQAFNLPFWPDVIVNQISDADTHKAALARSILFCESQAKPVINDPRAILQTGRDAIYHNTAGVDGLHIPKTVLFNPKSPSDVIECISKEQFTYPVIFRTAGDHGGISTKLIISEADVDEIMYQYALDGRAYYLTQFVDYKSDDNNYRKYRLVVVEGRPYLRHLVVFDEWLIHVAARNYMREHPEFIEEEKFLLNNYDADLLPRIQPVVTAITERIKLDYYGIDCSFMSNGDLLIFEINANMNMLPNIEASPNRWDDTLAQIKQHLAKMICERGA